jgi:hypothetical protein
MEEEGCERLPQIIEEEECVICFEKTPSQLFMPCFHLCCCQICSRKLERCPLCRSEIFSSACIRHDFRLDLQTNPPAGYQSMPMYGELLACDHCEVKPALVGCGHGCETAYYCGQECADAHYGRHDCGRQ